MHNNSSICTINPILPRQQTKKKILFFFFNDIMMTSSCHYSSPSPTEHGLVQEKKNFPFSAKILGIFRQKTLRFPSSNIKPSI